MTIVEFLTARYDHDEQYIYNPALMPVAGPGLSDLVKRARADIAAKRRIVHQHTSDGAHECPDGFMDSAETEPHIGWEINCVTLRLLALPYADHPDYDEAWKP